MQTELRVKQPSHIQFPVPCFIQICRTCWWEQTSPREVTVFSQSQAPRWWNKLIKRVDFTHQDHYQSVQASHKMVWCQTSSFFDYCCIKIQKKIENETEWSIDSSYNSKNGWKWVLEMMKWLIHRTANRNYNACFYFSWWIFLFSTYHSAHLKSV